MPHDHQNYHPFRGLGICWLVYGIFRLLGAVWLLFFWNTATVMFGTLLNRVADPFTMMDVFHGIYTFVIVLSAICGVLGVLAGAALLAGRSTGRALGIVAGLLSLSEIPVGLSLGVYSLIVLLPSHAAEFSEATVRDHAPELNAHTRPS